MKWLKSGYLAIIKYFSKSKGNKVKMLTNNTGVSIKSWLIYVVALSCIFMFLVMAFSIIWDTVHDGRLDISLSDAATFIGSLGFIMLSAVIPKAAGEYNERKHRNDEDRRDR